MSAVAIVVGILSASGGVVFGALVRQPEINKLKAELQRLQDELGRMQGIVKNTMRDIEWLKMKMQLEKNEDIIEDLRKMATGEKDADIGTLIYAYGLKEYLNLKVNFLVDQMSLTDEETAFVDSFALVLADNLPDGEDGKYLMQFIKTYVKKAYQKELDSLTPPDLDTELAKIEKRVEAFAQEQKKQETSSIKIDPDLECLTLSPEYTRILYSLKRRKVQYDIDQTDDGKKRASKREWLAQWAEEINTAVQADSKTGYFITDEDTIYEMLQNEIKNSSTRTWVYLVAFELQLFEPYFPMKEGEKENKLWHNVRYQSNYLEEVFCKRQQIVPFGLIKELQKTYGRNVALVSNEKIKTAFALAITTVVTVATAGLATAFAPTIAVALTGSTFTHLSGAALTSASLAYLGGGAIAAGGLGVSGGIAMITGGGALIGMAGSGASMLSAMLLLSSEGYALQETAKLLTFMQVVLIGELHSDTAAKQIWLRFESQLGEYVKQETLLEGKLTKTKDEKQALARIKKSIDYMKRGNKAMQKLIANSK